MSEPPSIPASTRTPSPVGQRRRSTRPVAGRKPFSGVLRVQPDLDGVAGRPDGSGVEPQPLAGRDPELVGDQVAPGHELGHRMLDLEPRVHLEEGRDAAVVDEELAGARVHVADRAREGQRGVSESLAKAARHGRRWRLLEDLLVAALDRAVPLSEVGAGAVGIEQDLDLDVTSALDQALEDEPIVAERGRRLASRAGQRVHQPIRIRERCASPCRRPRPPA